MRAARGSLIGWVLVAALASAGCTGGGDDPPPTSSAPPASPTAVTSSPSATPSVVEPTLPPEAMAQTDIGAVAFVKYWYSLVNYAFRTGDEIPLARASDSTCETCTEYGQVTREKTADGTVLDGDSFVLEAVNAPKPKDGLVIVEVVLHRDAVRAVHPDGTTEPVEGAETLATKALVKYVNGGWTMLGVGQK